jgi:hypothetical protein
MAFNEKALLRAKECILADPSQFDMYDYQNELDEKSSCGTTACIAGWIVFNEYPKCRTDDKLSVDARRFPAGMYYEHLAEEAVRSTNLDVNSLFHEGNWPEKYYTRFQKAKTRKEKAKIAAEVIDYFIESEKRLETVKDLKRDWGE